MLDRNLITNEELAYLLAERLGVLSSNASYGSVVKSLALDGMINTGSTPEGEALYKKVYEASVEHFTNLEGDKILKPNDPYEWAKSYLGLKERLGSDSNPIIEEMFKDVVGYKYKDDVAWCAGFVGHCKKRAGVPHTGKLNARSYLDWGVKVGSGDYREGDTIIFWREHINSWKGHVAFLVKIEDGLAYVLGGNQNNEVNIKTYPVSRILGIRRAA